MLEDIPAKERRRQEVQQVSDALYSFTDPVEGDLRAYPYRSRLRSRFATHRGGVFLVSCGDIDRPEYDTPLGSTSTPS